ncbi:iron ABC transporter permease [Phycobacter sp. 'Weihai']
MTLVHDTTAEGAVGAAPLYARIIARRLFWLTIGAAALGLAMVLDILTGPAMLGLADVLHSLFLPGSADATNVVIVWSIRLPMTLMAVTIGVALSVAGVAMQTILGNPLASPYTLGLSAAAGFGASLALLTGITLPILGLFTVPFAAFVASACASALVYGFSRVRGMSSEIMVLAGIATLFLFQSLQSMLQYMAEPEVLQAIVFWLFGSLLKASWSNLPISAGLTALCILALLPDLWRLTALRMGDERAAAVGVDVGKLRIRVFTLTAILTAGAICFVGTIGFVGLVAPHIARMLVGEDQRFLVPMAALTGAFVMVAASVLSKLISPGHVIPIGIVTAVFGVPFLFILILRGKRRSW